MDRPADLGKAHLRVARPSDDLLAVVEFYRDGLGFEVLYEFKDQVTTSLSPATAGRDRILPERCRCQIRLPRRAS